MLNSALNHPKTVQTVLGGVFRAKFPKLHTLRIHSNIRVPMRVQSAELQQFIKIHARILVSTGRDAERGEH